MISCVMTALPSTRSESRSLLKMPPIPEIDPSDPETGLVDPSSSGPETGIVDPSSTDPETGLIDPEAVHCLPCADSENIEECHKEWERVFVNLDKADGKSDGRIDRKALVKWVSALDLHNTIEFEKNLNINRYELERLVSRADDNKDGFVDKEEFLHMIDVRNEKLNKNQQSLLHQYLRVAAFAETYRWWPPPLFTLILSFAQVCIYIYHIIHFTTHRDHIAENVTITWTGPEPLCSIFVFNPSRRFEFWRYLSYSLVHAGVQHILFNMIMQLCVGLPLEMSHGTPRIAVVYFAGVLAGSFGTSAVDPNVYLAGASGGVYALIAAHLATLALNWKEDTYILQHRLRSGKSTKAKHGMIVRTIRLLAVLLYAIVDTGVAVYQRHFSGTNQRTGYVAHLCGALVGLLIGIIVLKNRKVEFWEKKLKMICVIAFLILFAISLIWNTAGNQIYQAIMKTNETYFKKPDPYFTNGHNDKCHYFSL